MRASEDLARAIIFVFVFFVVLFVLVFILVMPLTFLEWLFLGAIAVALVLAWLAARRFVPGSRAD